jgi:hypothetical protein
MAFSSNMSMHEGYIELSAPQSVAVYGWTAFKPYLTWDLVRDDPRMTFRFLMECGLSAPTLHKLQPSAEAWVNANKVDCKDCVNMTMWPLLPTKHLCMDLADIIAEKWTVDQLVRMGVDFQQLLALGLHPQIMNKLRIPLSDWKRLGMRYEDVQSWQDAEIHLAFGLQRGEMASRLVGYSAL